MADTPAPKSMAVPLTAFAAGAVVALLVGVFGRLHDPTLDGTTTLGYPTVLDMKTVIATGIGLHNFGEGLAIGQAAASDEVSLALVLIIGFALHNATEGFGIVGPMSGEAERPSWGFLALLGLIGGGPTFVGTVIGQAWVSEALQVLFFAVAAGSILYVVIQLVDVCRRYALPTVVAWWILIGLLLGFATDFVLVAAGA